MKSIYEEIVANLKKNNGVLSEDFVPSSAKEQLAFLDENEEAVEVSLPEGEEDEIEVDGPVTWAPGAKDGVLLYHTQMDEPDEEELENIGRAIECLANRGENEFLDEVAKIATPTISIVRYIYDYIIEHQDELDPNVMVSRALNVMEGAFDLEAIKFALAVSSMVDLSSNEDAASVVRNLSRYEEFSVFSIYNFLAWQETSSEKEILDVAKNTRGWGRVHAVSCLDMLRRDEEVELSQETKDWVFKHGIDNGVLPSYSAEPTFMIADCEKKIEDDINSDDMECLVGIFSALYEEPQFGIESIQVENGECGDLIKRMLSKCKGYLEKAEDDDSLAAKIRSMIDKIKEYHIYQRVEEKDREEIPEDMFLFNYKVNEEIIAVCEEI